MQEQYVTYRLRPPGLLRPPAIYYNDATDCQVYYNKLFSALIRTLSSVEIIMSTVSQNEKVAYGTCFVHSN